MEAKPRPDLASNARTAMMLEAMTTCHEDAFGSLVASHTPLLRSWETWQS